ncbi:MAG: acyl-CoA dehydrogenase [Sphingobium sp.]|nr:MAG: acyl-CoA dehydrogenase [Sphingobium sp.]
MDLAFGAEDQQFREEIRQFLTDNLPADIQQRQRDTRTLASNTHDLQRWMQILDARGWSVPHWETAYGGTDWSPLKKFIFEEELHQADAPEFHWQSTHMIGPIIYMFGSDAQKARYLPSIRRGDYLWCQGFSEPGAGSDLVSLKTTAIREGDHFRVNGQKIWTSAAFESEWGFFLVKTDTNVKPQRGISFLLIDMETPGITVRRIGQINGEAELCEVFLDDVMVPAENLVGEAGMGWTYAKALLDHERTVSSFIHFNKRELRRAKEIAQAETAGGRRLIDDPQTRARLVALDAQVTALEWSVLRVLADEPNRYGGTAAASTLKITGSRLQQAITELQADLLGPRALRYYDPVDWNEPASPLWPHHVAGRTSAALISRASTIYGGSEQVQKNILSKIAFGL